MLFPILVALVAVQPSCGSLQTYQFQEPITNKLLTCDRCPPGFHMLKHCTSATPTVCKPCPPNHYTQYWNYLPRCLYCSTFCSENQRVKEECSSQNNRVCECEEGFHSYNGFCIRHKECPPGHGVKRRGTTETDTDCEKCPHGSFSRNFSSSAGCANHTNCASLGRKKVIRGTCWHDNICANSCEELKDGGGFQLIRTLLLDFFQFYKMGRSKLGKLVYRLTRENGKPPNRRLLLNKLRDWFTDATEGQLRSLPKILRNIHPAYAGRLERKMRMLNGASDCNKNINVTPPPHCEANLVS
ncbi:tumor necrosis factor receptor superfamily member 6B-like [Esox lucius]|uniref:TNFR-Cys domain-containing protein n=1 Tax=Esox lucius TaxID=8010 RepID=A0A3P8ZBC1_ESOLU|nr:tumor necrosis factor receptor superfamily member 6B-like [Esox lucius]